ncbi:hypothetical protein acsn021_12090 [Anaerocolumna cellulosilytica]|uniref:Uncharacterized protein n=1 Tax=Anaerocolumna cellulosilytica TaxID=433286 RepID=A0A6S6R2U5_9FIRM|nr:hypothetical protein acsn021_12090 [Anaerocolumna cellulosilytica]
MVTKEDSRLQTGVKDAFRLQKMILRYKDCILAYKNASRFTTHQNIAHIVKYYFLIDK